MKVNKRNLAEFIFLLILVILITIGIVQFNSKVTKELNASVAATMHAGTIQQQSAINDSINTLAMDVISIANTFSVLETDKTSYLRYMNSIKLTFGFDSVIISELDGSALLSTGFQADISDEGYIEAALASSTAGVVGPFTSPYTGNEVLAASTIVYRDNVPSGVVVVTYNMDHVKSFLFHAAAEHGELFIIDGATNFITSTSDEIPQRSVLQNTEFDEDFDPQKLLDDIANGKSGTLSYFEDGVLILAEYVPIAINDWMLFYSVQESAMVEQVVDIKDSMNFFIFVVSLMFVVFIMYIFASRRKFTKQIEKTAYYDELTGIPNLIKFKIDIGKLLKSSPRGDYIIVKMDIVNFKAINELFSVEMGNDVLKTIAQTGDFVDEPSFYMANTGTDEFLLFAGNGLFDNLGNTREHYEMLFRKLLPNMRDHVVSFRFGRYFIEHGETDVDEIIARVNMAHGNAKGTQISDVYDYDDAYKKQLLRLVEITNKMTSAIKNGDFKVFLQPKCELENGKVMGAEALVRWIEEGGHVFYPDEFISHFEKTGFIETLDMYMLNSVCKIISSWTQRGYPCIKISVNFSKLHLDNPNFAKEIGDIVRSHNVNPKYIEVELTETAFTDSKTEVIDRHLEELHNAGFSVSLDDFGAGYSTLGMLKNFMVDTIKLDRSFFLNDKDDERAHLVIKGIVDIAHDLKMCVVAEGAEEESHISFLRTVGCELVQSYYFSKPISIDDFENKYIKHFS